MAKSSTWGFTNSEINADYPLTFYKLKQSTNYAVKRDEPEEMVETNTTAPLDQEEIISYRCKLIPTVNSNLNIRFPAPVQQGIQYQIQIEDTLSTTDSDDADFRVDEPCIAYLTVRHPRSGQITNAIIGELVTRLISSCKREDGTWRFDDLMRQSLKPNKD